MNKTCYIVGAGPLDPREIKINGDAYIIAADGGYSFLKELGIIPDMLLGDFDSLGEPPEHPNTIRVDPVDKDDTDMMLAVKTGLGMGFGHFVIYGGLGGRLDHTLANIQTLAYISKHKARGYLIGGGMTVTALTDGEIRFDENCRGYISVFCHGGEAEGVYERGLKYSLENARLTPDMPLGVSNEFTGKPSSVSVARGTVIITWQNESLNEIG